MLNLGVLSFLISLTVIFISQRYFIKKNRFDIVNYRSSHDSLATRNGGLSVFTTIIIITLYLYYNSNELFDFSLIIPLSILFTIGLYDDLYQVDFKLKFIFQIIIAKILIDQGFLIENLNGFLGLYEIPYMFSQLLSIFLIVLIVNAVNFSDGIDGLAITEVIKGLIFIIILLQDYTFDSLNLLLLITICSTLPLYFFNFKKNNKVFLGDSGSLLLGGIVSVGIIYLGNAIDSSNFNLSTPWIILVCLLYPIIDLIQVVCIRIYKGVSPFEADRSHIHHLLLNRGFSHLKTLLIISGVTGIIQVLVILLFTN